MNTPVSRRAIVFSGAALPMLPLAEVFQQLAPAAMQSEDGDLYYVGRTRDPVRIKVSPPAQGRLAMIVQQMAPGSRIPVHLHDREDEIIFIHSGTGTASVGETQSPIRAGSILYVPQGTWHGGENTGSTLMTWVAIYSPSGFEGYFREIGTRAPEETPRQRSTEEWAALDKKYAIRYKR